MSRLPLFRRSFVAAILCAVLGGCDLSALKGVTYADADQPASPASGDATAATLVRLGDHTLASGDLPSAVALYRRAHEAAPADPSALRKLSAALGRLGAYEESAGAYRAVLRLRPSDQEALRGLANAEIALRQPAEALPWLEAALAGRDSPETRNSLGVALDLLGRHAEAQTHYLRGLTIKPDDADLGSNYGLSLALAGQYDRAVAQLREVAASPDATVRHRLTLALALGLAGRVNEAAAVAGRDLDPAALAAALDDYARLRSIPDSGARAAAIGGGAPAVIR